MRTTDKICDHCGNTFSCPRKKRRQRFCSHSCAFKAKTLPKLTPEVRKAAHDKADNTRRGSGRSGGYIKRGGRHEHRVVAEEKLGRPLAPGEIAHHVDENKRNNDPSNVDVLPSQGDHARLHFTGSKRPPKLICKNGHDLDGDNVELTSIGRRRCRTCRRKYDREWKKAARIAVTTQSNQENMR